MLSCPSLETCIPAPLIGPSSQPLDTGETLRIQPLTSSWLVADSDEGALMPRGEWSTSSAGISMGPLCRTPRALVTPVLETCFSKVPVDYRAF